MHVFRVVTHTCVHLIPIDHLRILACYSYGVYFTVMTLFRVCLLIW